MEKDNTRIVNSFFWALALFFVGMIMIINQSLGFDLSMMPGDLGDGRFNNYILEHGYQYLIGKQTSYWNAPFFFPEKDVISYSDNLFGALPVYAACRLWVDRETAFQLWYLILIALNFWGAYYAIRKLNVTVYASSVGAFIYAFSMIILSQTAHIQLLPRFAAPFAIVGFYLWLQGNKNRYFYISMLLLIYQFYCAIYLGYFLVYVLIVLFGVYLIKERTLKVVVQLVNTKKHFIQTFSVLCFVLFLFGVLFYPYYLRSIDGDGYPSIDVLKDFTPRLWSYIYASDRSMLWGWLKEFVVHTFASNNYFNAEHHLFIGALPFIFLVASIYMYRNDTVMRFFLLSLAGILIITISIFNFSLFSYIVYLIPGARAIRVVSRYIVIGVFLWSMIAALFLDRFLSHGRKYLLLFLVLIPVLLVLDNMQTARKKGALKSSFQKRCMSTVKLYTEHKHENPNAKAFTVHADIDSISNKDERDRILAYTNIDAMMASQLIGLPCVNGYSAKAPPDYETYFFNPSDKNLEAWLHSDRVRIKVKGAYNMSDILILKKSK